MAHYLSELRNFRLYPDRDSGKVFRVVPADHKDLPPSTIAFPKQTVSKDRLQPFYYDLRPVIFVLQFAGVIPVTRSADTGLWNHGFLSPLMLYTAALYTTILVILWFTTGAKLQDLLATHRHFNVLFFVCMAVSYFLVVLCLPVINWPEAPNIARYLSSWTHFQEKYYEMLGRPLILSLRRRSILLCLILSPLIFSFEVVYQVNNEDGVLIDWWVAVKEWYLDVVRFFLASFWHLICASLARAARDLLDNFHRVLGSEKRITPITVATYRAVWVELSRLSRETGRAFCYTMGFYILYLFLTLTFFVYHTVSNLAREIRMDQLLMALECVVMGSTLFVVCDSATKTTHQVGEEFRDSLLAARIAVTDTYTQEEVDLFLRTIDTFPPDVSLADFVTVNRALFMSLGSMLTTYLIVLLQFNMSSEDNRGYNITLQI